MLGLRLAFQHLGQGLNEAAKGMLKEMGPQALVGNFEGDLTSGSPEAAYALTSKRFQARRSFKKFQAFVADHPELRFMALPRDIPREEQTESSDTIRLAGLAADDRTVPVRLRLLWEVELLFDEDGRAVGASHWNARTFRPSPLDKLTCWLSSLLERARGTI